MIHATTDSKLVGFAGKAGVGKTTTAEWFVHNYDFVRLSFATPLKESLSVLTGFSIGHFKDIELKETPIPGLKNVTPRILMQKMGTDFIREMIDPDFWVWRMRHMISEVSDRNIIIDDIRFPNEAQLVRDNGGKVVHLLRAFDSPTEHTSHKSETLNVFEKGDIEVQCMKSAESTASWISNLIL